MATSVTEIRTQEEEPVRREGGCPSGAPFVDTACLHLKQRQVSGHRQGSAFLPTALQGPARPVFELFIPNTELAKAAR